MKHFMVLWASELRGTVLPDLDTLHLVRIMIIYYLSHAVRHSFHMALQLLVHA
jgi:hypothetical protein